MSLLSRVDLHVFVEDRDPYETLPAGVALKRAIRSVMAQHVILHLRRRPEALVAVRNVALQRLLPRVDHFVPRHPRLGEHLSAVVARVAHILVILVFALLVLLQGSLLFEGLAALGARKVPHFPGLAVAEFDVSSQVGVARKGLAAVGAQVRLLVRVHP